MEPYPSLLNPATVADPYPFYRRLREEDPIHWDDAIEAWLLTRYKDVDAVLHDHRLTADRVASLHTVHAPEVPEATRAALKATLNAMILFMDPPVHTRLRNLANKAFTPRVVEALRQRIEDLVHELLAPALPRGSIDLIREFAYPLPAMVIAEMLGVRREDCDLIKRWSDALALLLGSTTMGGAVAEEAARDVLEFRDYLRELVAERRKRPHSDLISNALKVEEEGHMFSDDDLLANCILLLAAGHETTTNLIGSGMLTLLRRPDQLARLRAEPGLIKSAVEELLRFESPVQGTSRVALEDFELEGKKIQKGQAVLMMLAAANRDPARFTDPETLDLGRADNHHGAFAFGPHYCLGAPLARLEAQIAFPKLVALPGLALATREVGGGQTSSCADCRRCRSLSPPRRRRRQPLTSLSAEARARPPWRAASPAAAQLDVAAALSADWRGKLAATD